MLPSRAGTGNDRDRPLPNRTRNIDRLWNSSAAAETNTLRLSDSFWFSESTAFEKATIVNMPAGPTTDLGPRRSGGSGDLRQGNLTQILRYVRDNGASSRHDI